MVQVGGKTMFGGDLSMKVHRRYHGPVGWRKWLVRTREAIGWMAHGGIVVRSELSAIVTRADGTIEDLGIIGRKVVTDAWVNLLVDDLQASVAAQHTMQFHAMGTGSTAEAAADTALVTEVETRTSGTQVEGASSNIYRSVGTITATAVRSIREHGLFSASTAGTLLDRTVFALITLANGDSIQFTYELTCTSGG